MAIGGCGPGEDQTSVVAGCERRMMGRHTVGGAPLQRLAVHGGKGMVAGEQQGQNNVYFQMGTAEPI